MENIETRRVESTPKGVGVLCNWFAQKAENATIWDVEGREFIDFASGIAVLNVGHRHPRVLKAVEKQLQLFTHTAYQITPYESYIELAEKLNNLVPISGKKKACFFYNGCRSNRKCN